MTRNSTVDIRPVSAYSGAEIHGVDLSKPLAEQPYREIRNALCEYGAVFFRDQNLTPGQLLALARRFGDLHVSKYIAKVPGYPEVAEVRKEPEQTRNTGGQWHTDHAYADMPPLGSILQAQELPKTGGDTMFANMCAAYDGLSEGIKKTLLTMRAHHAKSKALDNSKLAPERRVDMAERATIGRDNSEREAVHPVTPRHPETGRRILFVNPTYTTRFEGWSVEESEPLLNYLYEHGKRAEYQCRFHWEVGSIAFWDNRTSWHYALNDYQGERRLMHRVSVQGPGLDPS